MSTAAPTGFGSDEFFRQMKRLWSTDQDGAATYLMDQVKRVCRKIIMIPDNGFFDVTPEDFEDYSHEAWLKMWINMEDFLSNPMNDPDSEGPHYDHGQKSRLAYSLIRWVMQQTRDRKFGKNPKGAKSKRVKILSTDCPVNNQAGGTTLGEFIPDPKQEPDRLAVVRDSVRDALNELFSLPSNPETLTAVAYVILNNTLAQKQSMNDYANALNQWTVLQAGERIETMLAENGMDPAWMLPLRRRMEKEGGDRPITGLTAAKLANRKNDVQGMFQKRMDKRDQ